jgi:DNA-binding CsgD family transcriptional regulator
VPIPPELCGIAVHSEIPQLGEFFWPFLGISCYIFRESTSLFDLGYGVAMKSHAVAEEDTRAIVRLLSNVALLDGGLAAKKQELMSGLQKLTDADGWLWSMTKVDLQTATPICVGLMHDGLTDEQLTGWLVASQTPSCPPPEDAPMFELSRAGKHFTRTRQQVVSDDHWYSHPAVQQHRLACGIDHFLYSIYPLGQPEVLSAIGLFRRRGRKSFSQREARMTHIILSEVRWLHYAHLPGDPMRKVPQLTPRQRVVLVMLIQARNRNEIARMLHISPHTVKDHMKAIYELFEVSSQLELIRRFRHGDGGDQSLS